MGKIIQFKTTDGELIYPISSSKLKLLWENSNPNGDFAGSQYINLSSDDYDYLLLYYTTSNSNLMRTECALKGKGFWLEFIDSFQNEVGTWTGPSCKRRIIDYVSDTVFYVNNSEVLQSGIAVWNYPATNVPVAIYGGKF